MSSPRIHHDPMLDLLSQTVDGVPLTCIVIAEVMDEEGNIGLHTYTSNGLRPWHRLGLVNAARLDAETALKRCAE